MQKSITILDLKRAIKNLPDDLPVYATKELKQILNNDDDNWYLTGMRVLPNGPISDACFELQLGDGFGY